MNALVRKQQQLGLSGKGFPGEMPLEKSA